MEHFKKDLNNHLKDYSTKSLNCNFKEENIKYYKEHYMDNYKKY